MIGLALGHDVIFDLAILLWKHWRGEVTELLADLCKGPSTSLISMALSGSGLVCLQKVLTGDSVLVQCEVEEGLLFIQIGATLSELKSEG